MGRDDHKHRSRRDDRQGKSDHEKKSRRREDGEERRHRRRNKQEHSDEEDSSRKMKHERKRKHRRDDDSDEERRQRRKRKQRDDDHYSEDDDRKKRKRDSRRKEQKKSSRSGDDRRKHKDKKEKKDKKDKKKDVKDAKDAKRPDKSKMHPLGAPLGRKPDKSIDPVQDYYSYHEHFWVYLYREEGTAFNDMTSEESKEAFERFAKQYNSGDLELEYYGDKLPPAVIEQSKTTKHSWSFNNVLTDREKKGLQTVQLGIRQQTEYSKKEGEEPQAPPIGPAICKPTASATNVEAPAFSRKTPEEIQEDRRSNKRLRNHVRNVEEELQGGPKDFRERQLDKRRQQGDRIHGASRAREDPGMELSDSALYGSSSGGGSGDRMESALAREKARKARRADARDNRIQELQAKEEGRQQNMLEVLGLKNLKPGQKITIAPRRDG